MITGEAGALYAQSYHFIVMNYPVHDGLFEVWSGSRSSENLESYEFC